MKAFYSDHFVLPLPEGHRFPMVKYAMLRDQLSQSLPGVQLLEAPSASDAELALAHSPAYVASIVAGSLDALAQREIGFPWSLAMVARSRRSVGATVAAARHALQAGVAANLAGGTHHAYADKGSGFCVFNDVAVAARLMQAQWSRCNSPQVAGHPVGASSAPLKVAVIDLDVHQGNGTAHIFRNDDSVFTLSLHGQKNFPFVKEQGDLDVALAEPVEVIRYEPGQLYRPHYDWFDAATPGGRTRIESMGQRLATVLIYLSDVAEGGSTLFPVLGLDVRPARGRALFFSNVDDRGETDRRVLHGGAPVVTGCKQIATCWFSSRRERQSLGPGQAASEV